MATERKHFDSPGDLAARVIASRSHLRGELVPPHRDAEEGGCGVVGFAASVPVSGRHIFEPSIQMHNRGNGKGGGIACAGFNPAQLGVDAKTLREDYIIQIALTDPTAESDVEADFIQPNFEIHHQERQATGDWQALGMPIKPPDIVRYFVRVKAEALTDFAKSNGLTELSPRDIEDEFVYQNSTKLNRKYYAALGEKRAFVLSHARNLMIFKVVGYAEHVVQYYGLEDFQAKVWIAHQRYPTKGRVWHPAGSHPFIGLNEALVHNGDFANYYSVAEYLHQHNITPQFLTDTEVSVQLFDLWSRTYKYPLEYLIEAMAPTGELDIERLSRERQEAYRLVQSLHVHSSPDGPWFFIIAQSQPDTDTVNLIGITDTAMLRPQVFAIQEGEVSIGLVGSEKQAIDATLSSLAKEDPRFRTVADRYWNARGGSHTDGGAFIFSVSGQGESASLSCRDKFGHAIAAPPGDYQLNLASAPESSPAAENVSQKVNAALKDADAQGAFSEIVTAAADLNLSGLRWLLAEVVASANHGDDARDSALELLTRLGDRRWNTESMRRSAVLQLVADAIDSLLDGVAPISGGGSRLVRLDWASRAELRAPDGKEGKAGKDGKAGNERGLVILARDFPPEGPDCDSQLLVKAWHLGWQRFIVYGLKGQRFHGSGLGPDTEGVRIDIYGSSGDYLASGIDGLEIHVHGNAQDQLGQIMKRGRLVVHGDVGQAFMYGAKGGDVYVMGNGAGRPLINAVGRPRVVINGTCLDYLAESFMAGDPFHGGGFVILNAVEFDDTGRVRPLDICYPGSNLFSLASGGAIYARDPKRTLVEDQLNGGEFSDITEADWELILPYLEENERLFGISVEDDLLTVDGVRRAPSEVYRKVSAVRLAVLSAGDGTE
jgi:glutamate synthase domain-containing protein 1/glutamate synthase domain-containing protein 3